jgi:PleD family two-component response regulator
MSHQIACIIHNPEIAKFIEIVLEHDQYDFRFFPNASTFVAEMTRYLPRIIVTERHFADGYDAKHLCELIRLHYRTPYIYIIMLSTSPALEDIESALSVGVDDYVLEPFFPQQIHARLMVARKWLAYLDSILAIQSPGPFEG